MRNADQRGGVDGGNALALLRNSSNQESNALQIVLAGESGGGRGVEHKRYPEHERVPGYASDGTRWLPAVLQQRAFQVLGALIRSNAAPERTATSLLICLEPQLLDPLQRFAALLPADGRQGELNDYRS